MVANNLWRFSITEKRTTKDENGFSCGKAKTITLLTFYIDDVSAVKSCKSAIIPKNEMLDRSYLMLKTIEYAHSTNANFWDIAVPIPESSKEDICSIS